MSSCPEAEGEVITHPPEKAGEVGRGSLENSGDMGVNDCQLGGCSTQASRLEQRKGQSLGFE